MSPPVPNPTTLEPNNRDASAAANLQTDGIALHAQLRQVHEEMGRVRRARRRLAMLEALRQLRVVLLHLRDIGRIGAGDWTWLNMWIKGLGEVAGEIEEMVENEPVSKEK